MMERFPKPKPFSFEKSTEPLALRYRPEYLARGGEHLVYEIPDHPDIVVKLNKQSAADTVALAYDLRLEADSDDPQLIEELKKRLEYKRKLQTALRECFGREHVVPQKYFLQTVPLPHDVTRDLRRAKSSALDSWKLPDLEDVNITASKAIIAIQPRLEELNKSHLCIMGGNLEWRRSQDFNNPKFIERYSKVTNELMSAEQVADSALEPSEFMEVIDNPMLRDLLDEAATDAELQSLLRDFLERAVTFAERTGEIIDYGKDNIIFFKAADGHWTYKIVDGLYGLQEDILETAKGALQSLKQGARPEREEQNAIIQAMNFTRITNGIGKFVGAKKIYSLLPKEERMTDILSGLMTVLKRAA